MYSLSISARISCDGYGYGLCTPLPYHHRSTKTWLPIASSNGNNSDDTTSSRSSTSSNSSETLTDGASRNRKGFGSLKPTPSSTKSSKQSSKSSGATSRRPAPSKPAIASEMDPQSMQTENAIILTLTALGSLIFVEGIFLAASGLLPEQWDAIIVKYVYPSFTPTVGLFLAGAVFYGVYKVFQGGQKSSED